MTELIRVVARGSAYLTIRAAYFDPRSCFFCLLLARLERCYQSRECNTTLSACLFFLLIAARFMPTSYENILSICWEPSTLLFSSPTYQHQNQYHNSSSTSPSLLTHYYPPLFNLLARLYIGSLLR